ncbi:hypothetical protein FDENT_4681 [Fusarium denticulatum]|uniref:Uncharacterized protein n=1 Tax=Fusarium denticulatum TaxID=48507 RepID=A0A8H5UJY4_9HYPO|nr:hypothetical protein FDENT_4681 [Fusarium denticulatum]
MGDQQTSDILETDVYGQNILHASITWPAGLDLLLQQSKVLSLLHDRESNSACPLEIAIWYSGRLCTQADKWALCSDCDCAAPVQQLLEADCCVLDDYFDPVFRESCSFRCRKLLFKHLGDRRRRLRDISLATLPSEVIERYGVAVDSIPNATASFLWEELQSRSDEWGKQGYRISGGLKPSSRECRFDGLFERLLSPEVCSSAGEFGIVPSDEGGFRPILARVASVYDPKAESVVTYLNWLMKHDLKLEDVTNGSQTSVLHQWGGPIGRHVGPCGWVTAKGWRAKVLDEDERSEILDEDSFLLEKLDNLDEEFAREFESRHETVVDFLRGYYTERMEEVVKEMDVAPGDEYKRGLLAAGVVLAEHK